MKKTSFLLLLAFLGGLPAHAQTVILKYESPPGHRLGYSESNGRPFADSAGTAFRTLAPLSAADMNGDDVPDLIMQREDEQGHLTHILVVDAQTGEVLWQVDDVRQTLGWSDWYALFGFADPDGDGDKEAIFYNEQDVHLYDPSDNALAWSWAEANAGKQAATGVLRLRAVVDMTDDGFEEIVIARLDARTVQVWGRSQ